MADVEEIIQGVYEDCENLIRQETTNAEIVRSITNLLSTAVRKDVISSVDRTKIIIKLHKQYPKETSQIEVL